MLTLLVNLSFFQSILLILIAIVILYYWLTNTRQYRLVRQMPGPKPKPLVGNLDLLWKQNRPITEALFSLTQWYYDNYHQHGM